MLIALVLVAVLIVLEFKKGLQFDDFEKCQGSQTVVSIVQSQIERRVKFPRNIAKRPSAFDLAAAISSRLSKTIHANLKVEKREAMRSPPDFR